MAAPSHAQLRAFLAVHRTGSLPGAARALGISQPAVSQLLDALEAMLGVRLFERGVRRALPTAAAEQLRPMAQEALAALADIPVAMAGFREGGAGRITIGTGATACIHLLPPILARLKRARPALEIVVETGNTDDMLAGVEDGRLDIGIVTMPGQRHRRLVLSPLCDDELVALYPAALAPGRDRVRPADLAQVPLLLFEARGTTRGLIDAWFAKAGIRPAPLMQLGNIEAIKVLVGAGLGATVLPQLALGHAVPPATVARKLRPALRRRLATALRPGRMLDAGMRALIAELGRAAGVPRG